ncbi:recQ-mediated genome instability protein 2-like [Haliotis rubra]|uniref:recQ-mediated genome instability protein 2-like n=1 Tax=Haliotis rubra TaxID=36100 RepID=UPI001EE52F43|nr:recQ-mediated genome instability protein 2-like [Haliotis rubra]
MNILDLPSTKLFVSDLQHCEKSSDVINPNVKSVNWEMKVLGRKKIFGCVWVQGLVVQKTDKGDEIVLDDGTGTARIVGCDKVPPACPRVKPGQYAMVIGVMTAGGPEPTIRGIKIQDLSGCMIAESMWMLEVIDCADT